MRPAALVLWSTLVFSMLAVAIARPVTPSSDVPDAGTAAAAPADADVQLEAMLVSGEQPGPGLWQVRRGDHVLWILGTQTPLPRRMQWKSDELEARIAEAGALVAPPRVSFGADIGRMRALLLLPSLLGARKDPEGRTLDHVLPPALHARWSTLKQRWIGRDRGIERWRPVFAAYRLFERAVEKSGLSTRDIVWPAAEKAAKRRKVAIVTPTVTLKIDDPKQAIRDFRGTRLDDIGCLERTVERLESDLDAMRQRANAWAIGDIEALRALPHVDNIGACRDALIRSELVSDRGLDDLTQRTRAAWLEAVDTALAEHPVSVAILPLDALLREDGVLAIFVARGDTVIAPE